MPDIDVTDVLVSLDIADQSFSVVRRLETVNAHGELVITETVIPDLVGACQPLGDNSMLREEMYTTNSQGLQVWTAFRLYNEQRKVDGTTYQPDLVLFDGAYYLVKSVDGWEQFGAGFTHAECIGFAYVPPPSLST